MPRSPGRTSAISRGAAHVCVTAPRFGRDDLEIAVIEDRAHADQGSRNARSPPQWVTRGMRAHCQGTESCDDVRTGRPGDETAPRTQPGTDAGT